MLPFDALDPELAARESRAVHVIDRPDLPAGTYVFREFYCNEPRCDCRRVLLQITSLERGRVVATVHYAFEPPAPPFDDEGQMFLDPVNPQSELSEAMFALVEHILATDEAYRARLVEHYTLWKKAADDPGHPAHARVRSAAHDDPDFRPAFNRREPARREGRKVGPNEPCPCGSGKKYKKCCGR